MVSTVGPVAGGQHVPWLLAHFSCPLGTAFDTETLMLHFTWAEMKWSWCNTIVKKNDLLDTVKEFETRVTSMKCYVTLVQTDSEFVYVHGALAKYYHHSVIRVSISAPSLKEMNGQVVRYFGTVMMIARALLTTYVLPEKFWPLAVYNATYVKNQFPCSTLVDRSPYYMTFGYNPNLSHLRMLRSQVYDFIPLYEREGFFLPHSCWKVCWARRLSNHMHHACRENEQSFKKRYCGMFWVSWWSAATNEQYTRFVLADDFLFWWIFPIQARTFLDSISEDNPANLKAHAAWYNDENHETLSVMEVETTKCLLGAWMLTRLYLMMSTCAERSWSVAARFTETAAVFSTVVTPLWPMAQLK